MAVGQTGGIAALQRRSTGFGLFGKTEPANCDAIGPALRPRMGYKD